MMHVYYYYNSSRKGRPSGRLRPGNLGVGARTMTILRRSLCLVFVAIVAACGSSPEVRAGAAAEDAADREAATANDPRRDHLVRAARTHVLVIDGERIPPEERVPTARRLDLSRLESITLHDADDPHGRELIGDEADVDGAIVLVLKSDDDGSDVEGDPAGSETAAPAVRDRTPFPVRQITDRLRSAPWSLAGEDPEGDGRRVGYQDGRALWFWLDAERDTLWVRLGVYGEIDEERPAVSLSFDLDDDQETGVAWYGSNTVFRFDKMVSAGPTRREGDRFIGYNGITDADGVRRREWINERQGNVAFLLDPAESAYIVGVALSDLEPRSSRVRFIGSVGHRATWNDDLIDRGSVVLTLPRSVD